MYANDNKIWRNINSIEDSYIIQRDIDYMMNWASLNKMNFHPNKCKVLQVSSKRSNPIFSALPFSMFYYRIGDCILDYVDFEKDLGVHVTNNLNWSEHCNRLYTKASQMFGLTRRTAHFVKDSRQRRALYLSMVRSQFEHCSVVWRPPQKTLMEKFECLQKRCIKWILDEQFSHYSNEMYFLRCKNLEILPICYRFDLSDLIFFHKIYYQLCPVTFPSYLKPFTGSSLRSSHLDDLCFVCDIIPRTSASTFSSFQPFASSFFYRTFSAWNNLPYDVRSLSCPISFKNEVSKILWARARDLFVSDQENSIEADFESDFYN